MDAVAELGRNLVSKHQIQPEYGDEQADAGRIAEPVSRDQIFRCERGQGKIIFPVQLTTSMIGNLTRLILTLAICGDHTYYIVQKVPEAIIHPKVDCLKKNRNTSKPSN